MFIKQFFLFTLYTLVGMIISHYIPTKFFLYWVFISLFIGHLLNRRNYK